MKIKVMTAGLGLCLSAGAVNALEAHVAKDTAGSAEAAWAAVGDFCGIANWHPVVAKCEISVKDGATFRTLTLKDGAKIYEKQTAFDKAKMSYSYTIEESPLPVANYKATLTVKPKDKGATIDWSASFDAKGAADADAVKTISGIFDGGVDALVAKSSK